MMFFAVTWTQTHPPGSVAAPGTVPSRDHLGATLHEAGQRVFAHLVCLGSVTAAARGAGARGGDCSVSAEAQGPATAPVGQPVCLWFPCSLLNCEPWEGRQGSPAGDANSTFTRVSLAWRRLRPSCGDQLSWTLTWHTCAHHMSSSTPAYPPVLPHTCLSTPVYPPGLIHTCSSTCAHPHVLIHMCSPTRAHLVGAQGGPARFPHPSSLSPHPSPVSGPAGPSHKGGHWPQ